MVPTRFSALASHVRALDLPAVVGVDGRSASGKTTFAKRLAHALDAPLIHTDDVAWHYSFFDWWPLLVDHIIVPFRAGQPVDWIPDAWAAKGRAGSIQFPVSSVLVIEGVSSTRRELASYVDVPIWVETDPTLAEARGLERDGPDGREFWFEWQASERPFFEADRPWERATLIVDGVPSVEHDVENEFVLLAEH